VTATAIDIKERSFEQLYSALRDKEGRIYTDEEVLHLPDISKDHPHYTEWQMRKESCNRLKNYFEKKISSPKILEVGSGNGWLSRRLSEISGSKITGTDINFIELQQAVRVFNHIPNLQFIPGGIHAEEIEDAKFDFIVFAASIQYFSSLKEIINLAFRKLEPNGEIHILDSNFYKSAEISAAKERTARYYSDLGFPEMTKHYFHHTTDELHFFSFKILYRTSFIKRLSNNKNPFPWICIREK
jgi:ubiquinone/menaquinone biosynthesis C-methylase UbiE